MAGASPGTHAYNDNSVQPGVTYFYRLRAENTVAFSAWTNVASARANGWLPSPPHLTGDTSTTNSVTLYWTAPTGGAPRSGYRIFRATNSAGPFTQVGTAGPNATSATVGGLVGATTYYFRMVTYNTFGTSTTSNAISGRTK